MLKPKSSIAHNAAGHFKTRAFEAAFIFAFGGVIFLASQSLSIECASARLLHDRSCAQVHPLPGAVVAPDQHRTPAARPVSVPQQHRADPIKIDPSQRHEIVQHQADEMKREHCVRKLEARRKALLERQRADRTNPAK
ncbi:MAG TPA: hypothetical protein VFD13_03500 [Candidatus Kapabacteria bacterium]|nr:hypothetical protein [Candidatus Kapabacteria bacterium]